MAKNAPKIYHHSNVKGVIIRIVVIILAAAFILALTAFFGFRKFIAYTDTGKLYLDIPWLYGYMDGPPEHDDLAPYLAPVETPSQDNTADDTVTTDTPTTEDDMPEDDSVTTEDITTEDDTVTAEDDTSGDSVQSVIPSEDDSTTADEPADPQ